MNDNELKNLAFESVIKREYENASYYYYWILKKLEETEKKDINWENDEFYNFYYYITSKLQSNWIVQNNNFRLNILTPIIIYSNNIPDKDKQFGMELSKLNMFIANHYNSILYDYKMLKHIRAIIQQMIEKYIAPKNNLIFNKFYLSSQILELIKIYKENSWGHINISPMSIYNGKTKQLDDVIDIISRFMPDFVNPGNFLFRLNSLIYLEGTVNYLLTLAEFLLEFNYNSRNLELLKHNLGKTKKIFLLGLDIFPISYQIYEALELVEITLGENSLSSNNLHHALKFLSSSGYLNEGSELNKNKKFNEAEQLYQEGLSKALLGDKHNLYYNLAKNSLDLFNKSDYVERNIYADTSIRYAQLSLFDFNLSLMKLFSLNSIYTNDEYSDIHNIIQNHSLMGNIYSDIGNDKEAINSYTSALSYYVNNHFKKSEIGDIYSNRGLSYLKVKEYDKSIEDSQTALFHGPQKPVSALLNIAHCYFQKMEYETALLYYEKILSISKNNNELCDTYHSMGLNYLKLNDSNQAIKCFSEALKYNSNDIINYKLIGQTYRKENNYNDAEKFFLAAASHGLIDVLFDLGDMYSEIENNDKAKEYFSKYVSESKKKYYDIINNYNAEYFNNSIFYKYKAINKFTFESLINNYVYLSDISGLNDPFDCRLIYEMNKNINLNEILQESGMPKIMSMSLPIEKDQLLWSHYADEHKGMRIGYCFSKQFLLDNNLIFSHIEYREELEINWMSTLLKMTGVLKREDKEQRYYEIRPGTDVDLLKSVIVKSKNWEYENEVRLIAFDKENKKYNSNKNDLFCIKEISFGCRTSDNNIETVLTILHRFYYNEVEFRIEDNKFHSGNKKLIEFSKLRRSKDNLFALEIDDSFSVEKYI